ncbi:hypothetical protein D3C85_1712280 [compost metagenome]
MYALHRFLGSSHDLISENLKLLAGGIKRHSKVFGRLNRAFLDTLDCIIGVYPEASVQHPGQHANCGTHHRGPEPYGHTIKTVANRVNVEQADDDAGNSEQKA